MKITFQQHYFKIVKTGFSLFVSFLMLNNVKQLNIHITVKILERSKAKISKFATPQMTG